MARLPTVQDLGQRPVAQPQRGIASVRNAGAVGQALQGAGAAIDSFETAVFERQTTAEATERDVYVSEQIREILYNPETGFTAANGRDAVDRRGQLTEQIEALRKGALDGLSNGARRKLEGSLNSRLESALLTADRHTMAQRESWLSDTSAARVEAALQDGVADLGVTDASLRTLESETLARGLREGWDPERTELELQRATSALYSAQISRIADRDPFAAMEYLNENKERMLPGEVASIESTLIPIARQHSGRLQGAAAAEGGQVPATTVVEAGAGYTVIQLANGQTVRREGTRAWRNNNPGNIEFGDFAKAHGAVGTDGRFAVFPTYQAGRDAKAALIFDSSSYRNLSIADAISRYAPAFENDTGSYIAQVAAAAGVPAGATMSSLNSEQRIAVLDAMERVEGFQVGQETGGSSSAPGGISQLLEIEDPTERKAAIDEFNLRSSVRQGEEKARLSAAQDAAFQHIDAGGRIDDIPQDHRAALGQDAMTSLRAYERSVASGTPIETDMGSYYALRRLEAENPETFRSMNLMNYADKLSQSDLKSLMDRQRMPVGSVSAVAASTLMTTANRHMTAAGINTNGDEGSTDAQTVAAMQTRLLQWQDGFIIENNRKPRPIEIDEQIGLELTSVLIDAPGWTGDSDKQETLRIQLQNMDLSASDLAETDLTIDGVSIPAEVINEQIEAMTARGETVNAYSLTEQIMDMMESIR